MPQPPTARPRRLTRSADDRMGGGLLLPDRIVPVGSWRQLGPATVIALGLVVLLRRGGPR